MPSAQKARTGKRRMTKAPSGVRWNRTTRTRRPGTSFRSRCRRPCRGARKKHGTTPGSRTGSTLRPTPARRRSGRAGAAGEVLEEGAGRIEQLSRGVRLRGGRDRDGEGGGRGGAAPGGGCPSALSVAAATRRRSRRARGTRPLCRLRLRRRPDRRDELHVRREAEPPRRRLDVLREQEGIERRRLAEGEDEPSRARLERADGERAQADLHRHDLEERLELLGWLAAAVHDLGANLLQLLVAPGLGEPLVEEEPLVDVGHVGIGDERGDGELHVRVHLLARRLAPELPHRLVEELRVELEADRLDLAGLVLAEEVPRPADLEIVARDLEARAELAEALQHLEPLLGILRHWPPRRNEQVRIGSLPRAADAAADLVQLGEPEAVGAVHDDGVRAGDVEAALDDRGREEDVELLVHEPRHHLLELPLRQLAVGDADAGAGHHVGEELLHRRDGADPVVDEEDLSAAPELVLDRLAHRGGVELHDEGADGAPVLRRRGDDGEVAHPREAHVQRARDRGRGEGEDVDELAELLQPLLVRDAEALLLVHHDEPEIREGDVGGEEPVRADEDVHLPGGRLLQHPAHLVGGLHARDRLDADRVALEPLAEAPLVLRREDGGRDEDRHLLLREHGEHGGAHRHLGLPVADVAADEPVHRGGGGRARPLLLHVAEHVLDGLRLIGRLLPGELRLELAEELVRRAEARPRVGRARRVDVEQLRRHLEELLLHPRLAEGERLAAEAVEPDRLRRSAGELLHLPELRDRQVEPVRAVIGEDEEVALHPADLHLGEAEIARDAVLDVDDEVSLVELAEGRREGVLLAGLARPLPDAPPEDLLVRDEREPGVPVDEAARDLAGDEVGVDRGVVQPRRRERPRVGPRVLAAVLEEAAEPVRGGRRPARHHGGEPASAPLLEPSRERRERALLAMGPLDLGAQPGGLHEGEADRLGGAEPDVMARDRRPRREAGEDLGGGEEVGLGWQRELLAAQGRLVLAGELRVEVLERLLDARGVVHVRDGARRQVIEERGEPARMKAGEERLHAEERRPLIDLLERLAHPRGGPVHPLRRVADHRLRRLLPLGREERLARGAEQDLRHVALAPLGLRLEAAAALHLVAEELEPHGRRVGGAPQIHDAAAHREGSGILDERHAREAEQHELFGERLARDLHAGAEQVRAGLEDPPRQLAAGEPPRRDHDDRAPLRRKVEAGEGGEPLELDAAVGGEIVVREDRVGGNAQHCVGADEEGGVARELIRVVLVGRHRNDRARPPLAGREELREEPAARGADEPRHVGAAARGDGAADARPGGGGGGLGGGGHRSAPRGGGAVIALGAETGAGLERPSPRPRRRGRPGPLGDPTFGGAPAPILAAPGAHPQSRIRRRAPPARAPSLIVRGVVATLDAAKGPGDRPLRSSIPQRRSAMALALLLAACGGAEQRLVARGDGVPVLETLATRGGTGAERLRAGDLAVARALFEADLAQDPDRLSALNDLAVSYVLDGHGDAARRLLDEVVASGDPLAQQAALVNLGELYAAEGYVSAAQAYLETARSLEPSRPEPLYALALLADGRGDLAAARSTVREALRRDDGGAARAALAYVYPEERVH